MFGVENIFWTFSLNVKWLCKFFFLTNLDEKRDLFITKNKLKD